MSATPRKTRKTRPGGVDIQSRNLMRDLRGVISG